MARAVVNSALLSPHAASGLAPDPSSVPAFNMRPEAELLICCARTRMNSDTAERMLLLGLFLARAFLGAALPEEVVHRVHADPVVPSLGAQVGEWLFPDADSAGGGWESCFFHLKVRERLRDVVRFCLGMIMIPNGGDRYLCMTC